ncbi:siroheme synthase CysG [Buchnera aphidicola]|uniref:siroheme synthase CysG n=1 Tax=Buchnera aphidicola TaxID=9 RepID=UPI003464A6F5
MNYFPIFANLKSRRILIVGGGAVAARKVLLLLRTGAIITIIAYKICFELLSFFKKNKIKWLKTGFKEKYLDQVFLVIAATNDRSLNEEIFIASNKRCIFVNTVDDESKCSFIFPSIIDRSPIIIGISSGGFAPVLSRLLRERMESLLPIKLGVIANIAKTIREKVKKKFILSSERRFFWERLFNGSFSGQILSGNINNAINILNKEIMTPQVSIGEIILVGAGPGDAGLLTLKGLQVIQQADYILYDFLVSKEILELVRRDAHCVYVGKSSGIKGMSQQDINELLISLAKKGKKVVRLKGGDPFIFGRGGEELMFLKKYSIPFQVVPGITAAIGAAAYSGIPLTHRSYAHSVIFITGNRTNNKLDIINWSQLATSASTIVIYMFKANVDEIYKKLIIYGFFKKTPVAVIEQATTLNQKILIGTIANLPNLSLRVSYPSILIIGEVVKLHKKLKWFN